MRWGAHQADARIAAKNAIKIQAALIQSIDAERIVQAYLHTHPTSNDPAQDKTRARAWAMMNIIPDIKPLKAVLRRHWAELYVTGVAAAGEAIYHARKASKAPNVGIINWDIWQPGDLATAALLRPPGALQDLLETAGIKISGINDTGYQNIGTALADGIARGDTITQMASAIQDVIASPQRALTIAVTEGSRAMTIGALANYQESGITQTEWSTSDPINCVCVDLDGEIRDIGEEFDTDIYQPPAHPNCRCVLFPVIPDYATGDVTDGGDGTDTGSFGGSDVASAIAFEDSGDWSDAESDTVFAPDKPKVKKKALNKYSEDQERDEYGRWTSGASQDMTRDDYKAIQHAQNAKMMASKGGELTAKQSMMWYGYIGAGFKDQNMMTQQMKEGAARAGMGVREFMAYRITEPSDPVRAMYEAFDKQSVPLEKDTTLYRGMSSKSPDFPLPEYQVGDVIEPKGWLSTTADGATSLNSFITGTGHGFSIYDNGTPRGETSSMAMQISVPAGTLVAVGVADENELILDPSTQMVVTDVRVVDGIQTINAKVVK